MSASARNPALDTLRTAAILLVVLGHVTMGESQEMNPTLYFVITQLSQRGVDLFFVLSGYLIGGIAIRELATTGALSLRRFWTRRWMRTLPAYYLVLGLYALKQFAPHRSEGLVTPWAYVLFVQSYLIRPLRDFAHSWSLCVEEHFYLVLPLLLCGMASLRLRRARHVMWVIGTLAFVFLATRMLSAGPLNPRLSHLRTDSLCVGVLLAAWEQDTPEILLRARAHAGALLSISLVLLAVACGIDLTESPHFQTGYALAFGGLVMLAAAKMPWLAWLGALRPVHFVAQVSYSLYLLHPLVLGTLDTFYLHRAPVTTTRWLIYVILGTTASLVVSALCYRFVERTFLSLRDRIARQPTGGASVP